MASVTLVESAKLSQDMLIEGLAEEIVTVDKFFQILPFQPIEGNALAINRESVLGDIQNLGVGGTITAKAAATFEEVFYRLTTIIGDAEVNGLIQATRSNINDQKTIQVMSKAKSLGRQYRRHLLLGSGLANEFEGLLTLVDSAQTVEAAVNGIALRFRDLDELLDQVTCKDGEVDFMVFSDKAIRQYFELLRSLGGASVNEVVTLPSGDQVPAYRNVPIFRNQYMPEDQTQGTSSTCTSIIAGTLDDGSMKNGVFGITAREAAGIQVAEIGESETKDESITRLKWYCGLALGSTKALAVLKGVETSGY